jgi:hypothetical protein
VFLKNIINTITKRKELFYYFNLTLSLTVGIILLDSSYHFFIAVFSLLVSSLSSPIDSLLGGFIVFTGLLILFVTKYINSI